MIASLLPKGGFLFRSEQRLRRRVGSKRSKQLHAHIQQRRRMGSHYYGCILCGLCLLSW